MLENTINQLDAEDCLRRVNGSLYGNDYEERLFNVAMELCITWMNRILFLKLLEAQMLKYHNGDIAYKFLSTAKIHDYDDLNTLFFQVLARDMNHRTQSIIRDFAYVPYLNSSLFEVTDLESKTIKINSLSQRMELPVLTSSVLRSKKRNLQVNTLPTLQYLFAFLDAYNFASEGSEEVQEEAKTLINASVLGLIFEKINGHKDGSVFTPGFITMFMCREAITKTVLQKFNDYYGWNCVTRTDLYNRIDNIAEANELINSLRLCDPAVGSGHFLVSALNELILLKYELGILVDATGKRIRKADYQFTIENDELIVTDAEGNLFAYNTFNAESRRIQETLFKEKRRIIENSLFGVDINPNSVKICRLRLWIELLKNAYYTAESNYTYLETLPNIDINIKCGNSLLHRFALTDSIQTILRESDISISQYKEAVAKYKNAQGKGEKQDLEALITEIKSKLKTEINRRDVRLVRLNKRRSELVTLQAPQLFEPTKKEKKVLDKRIADLKKEITALENVFEEIRSNKIYLGAFEWRMEFPEVLDEEGNFLGFDCIIGNPPYIQLQSMGKSADVLERMGYVTYARTGDIYCLFYELGMNLLSPNGHLCYITSNKWLRAGYGEALRGYFASKTNPIMLVDFAGIKIFDAITVEANILLSQKAANIFNTRACSVQDANGLNNLSDFVQQEGNICCFNNSESWIILSPVEMNIKRKIETVGVPLKDWNIQINYGIKTGFNDAFIISTEKRNEILANCQTKEERSRTAELIRPILRGRDMKRYGYDWAGLWLINTHNGLKNKGIKPVDINDYPAIKEWLDNGGVAYSGKIYKGLSQIEKRSDQGDTPYNLRNCAYMEDFSKPKIVWKIIGNQMAFAYDTNNYVMNNACYIMTGNHLDYLLAVLNSQAITWYSYVTNMNKTGVGDVQVGGQNIVTFPIPVYDANKTELVELAELANSITNKNVVLPFVDSKIESLVSMVYGFTGEETNFLHSFASSLRKSI